MPLASRIHAPLAAGLLVSVLASSARAQDGRAQDGAEEGDEPLEAVEVEPLEDASPEPPAVIADAATAYAEAQAAELRRDHERAARLYETAHRLAPRREALRSAARNRSLAGHHAAAATLANEALRLYPDDPDTTRIAREVVERAAPHVGRLTVECEAACTLAVDRADAGFGARARHVIYVTPGRHSVVAQVGEETRAAEVEVAAQDDARIAIDAPEPVAAAVVAPPPPVPDCPSPVVEVEARRFGISPGFVIAGAAVTLGLAAATAWSWVDHAELDDQLSGSASLADRAAASGAATRSYALLTAAGVAAVGTVLMAIFTDWGELDGDDGAVRADLAIGPELAALSVAGRWP